MRRYESEKYRKKSAGVKNPIGVRGFLSLYPVQYMSRLAETRAVYLLKPYG